MKWFSNPATLEELKKQYKQLVIKHHPDKGGNTADMQEINAEYDRLLNCLKILIKMQKVKHTPLRPRPPKPQTILRKLLKNSSALTEYILKYAALGYG